MEQKKMHITSSPRQTIQKMWPCVNFWVILGAQRTLLQLKPLDSSGDGIGPQKTTLGFLNIIIILPGPLISPIPLYVPPTLCRSIWSRPTFDKSQLKYRPENQTCKATPPPRLINLLGFVASSLVGRVKWGVYKS